MSCFVFPPFKFVSQKTIAIFGAKIGPVWVLLRLSEAGGPLVRSWWWALNQMAHSQEFSPVSNLGSQVVQM